MNKDFRAAYAARKKFSQPVYKLQHPFFIAEGGEVEVMVVSPGYPMRDGDPQRKAQLIGLHIYNPTNRRKKAPAGASDKEPTIHRLVVRTPSNQPGTPPSQTLTPKKRT